MSPFFSTISLKLITQLDHDESRQPIYFGVESSKVKVMSHENISCMRLCTLVGAGFFSLMILNGL